MSSGSKPRLLSLDIETAPNLAHVWALFKQNIGVSQLLDTSRVMCFSAKWVGEPRVQFFSEFHHGHEETIARAHELLEEADSVITYNGNRFDLPTLNREFLKYKMSPPAPYSTIDLLSVIKNKFRFPSNKLDHISRELGIGKKAATGGHQLWIDCMKGEPKAWARMQKYNKEDVRLTERLYQRILPWINNHPNRALYEAVKRPICPKCGSKHLQQKGLQRTKTQAYVRFQCVGCASWSRERQSVTPREAHRLVPV